MAIFLDSGSLEKVERYLKMGIIRGVTTNPSIMLKEGLTGGQPAVKERYQQLAKMIAPFPLSAEVTSNDPERMLDEAREFRAMADNINVKVTIHGPNGETDNLSVIKTLEEEGIPVNVTAMMSPQQCFLAAMAGASYVSLFCGRVNNMGYDSRREVTALRGLLDKFNLKAQIISASTREVLNVVEWLDAGSHIVTVLPDFLEKMIVHPYTKETVQMFLDDAAKTQNQLS